MLFIKLVHSFENGIFAFHILLRLAALVYLKSLLYSVSTLSLPPSSVVDPDLFGRVGSGTIVPDPDLPFLTRKYLTIFASFSLKCSDPSLISYNAPVPLCALKIC